MEQYEVKIKYFSRVQINVENAIVKKQENGWEMCGQISVPQNLMQLHCDDMCIAVPFRRKIN